MRYYLLSCLPWIRPPTPPLKESKKQLWLRKEGNEIILSIEFVLKDRCFTYIVDSKNYAVESRHNISSRLPTCSAVYYSLFRWHSQPSRPPLRINSDVHGHEAIERRIHLLDGRGHAKQRNLTERWSEMSISFCDAHGSMLTAGFAMYAWVKSMLHAGKED